MKNLIRLLFVISTLALAATSQGKREADADPSDRPNPRAEREAEAKRRQAEEQRIQQAQTLEATKQEALKIIQDGSQVRQDLQQLTRRENELSKRLEIFNRNDALMKTGIFGVISTGIVGLMAVFMNYRGSSVQRRLDQLMIIQKEDELRSKGLLK